MKQQKVLVVGASGNVGSQIVQLLKKDGFTVRATTSKKALPSSDGVEHVHLDVVTGEGLKAAFDGVDRAFLLSPPGYADMYKTLSPLIQEAKRHGLKKVVLMTALGANASDETPFRKAEIELEKSGLTYNIVRPNWFMQNFGTMWAHSVQAEGKLLVPAGNAKTSFIDTRDIAAVAEKLLTTETHNNRDFDLTGAQALDHAEVAKILSQVTGKPISYQNLDTAVFKKGLLSVGLPEDYADFLVLISGFLAQGYNAGVTENVLEILGRAPISFGKYAEDHKKAWL